MCNTCGIDNATCIPTLTLNLGIPTLNVLFELVIVGNNKHIIAKKTHYFATAIIMLFPGVFHNGPHFIVYNGFYSSPVANYIRHIAGDYYK